MLRIFLIILLSLIEAPIFAQIAAIGKPLPSWEKGVLDLHHINTGRGSAALFIFPDGTTMLLDAGEIPPTDPRTSTARNSQIKPSGDKKPYEWISLYIQKHGPAKEKTILDYALTTHFHDDHFGSWYPDAPLSSNKKYILSGITGVGDLIPIKRIVDRASPGYRFPFDFRKTVKDQRIETEFDKTFINYLSFIEEKRKYGLVVDSFRAGSKTQFVQKNSLAARPEFFIQNVKANGFIWTGKDSTVENHFPGSTATDPKTWPDENSLSLALVVNYGPFRYYSGGDNAGNLIPGDNPLRDVETAIAGAVGEVDIATMDHHGNRDAVNETFVRTLKPRIWIGQTWSADHPGHEVLIRITNRHIYPEQRDIFATNMLEANRTVIGPLIERSYKSQQGHIVVRVLPGGTSYYIIILEDDNPEMLVKAIFGPYKSKSNLSSYTSK